jgi:iron complex outermembrane receptor protein
MSRTSSSLRTRFLQSALPVAILSSIAFVGTANAAETIETVVVTAQKTSQDNQKVPIALTAFTAADLERKGITDVAHLSDSTPNVTLDAGTPFAGSDTVLAAFIRGIGQNDFAFNQDPGVGVYIDGVYLARSVGSNTSMLDVERVEILKGPQGTLFGRNTIGGAISIVTRDPGTEFTYKAEVTSGSYDRLDVRGTVDLPINDQLAATFSFSETHRDGYQKRIPYPGAIAGATAGPGGNIPDCDALAAGTHCVTVVDGYQTQPASGYQTSTRQGGDGSWAVRGKLVFTPRDDVKFTLAADYTNVDQSATPDTVVSIDPNSGGIAGLYNACISIPAAVMPFTGLATLCNSPRLEGSPVPTPVSPLPALGSVNVDGNPNNNRLPYDNRFIIPGTVRVGGTNTYVNPDLTYATGNSFSKLQNWGIAGTLDWRFSDNLALKSITAYRAMRWKSGMDHDGSPLDIFQLSFDMPQHQLSEELQLIGTLFDGRLEYVVGGYYFNEGGHLHDYVTFPGALLMVDGPNDLQTTAKAGYVHLNYKVTDALSITAGGRYSTEHKTFEGHQSDDNGLVYKITGCYPPNMPNNLGAPAFLTCQQVLGYPSAAEPFRVYPVGVHALNFDNFSPTVALQYQFDENVMAYASWSKGFKTGSWTTRLTNPQPIYDNSLHFNPEKATTEEVGLKSELFDRSVRLNVAGFHTDYRDIQLNSQIGTSPTLVNAGDARIWGAEIEAEALLGGGFSANASLGYTDAQYTRIAPGVQDNGQALTLHSCPGTSTARACDLPKTPKLKFNIGPQYIASLGDESELQFNLDYTYTSHTFNDLGNSLALERLASSMLNASITYRAPGDKWEVVVGGTNLTDTRNIVTGQNQGGVAVIDATFSAPREAFVTFRIRS